jgi:hypothetical protein
MNQVAYPEFGRSIKLSQGTRGCVERALGERGEPGLASKEAEAILESSGAPCDCWIVTSRGLVKPRGFSR